MNEDTSVAAPTDQRIEIALIHPSDGPAYLHYKYEHWEVICREGLDRKLLAADDGRDTYLLGVLKSGHFFATSVLEGGRGRLSALTPQDFVLFCEALSIPYINPANTQ